MTLTSLSSAEYGLNYIPTIKVFNGLIVALGVNGMAKLNQLRWDESLEEFKELTKGNWI